MSAVSKRWAISVVSPQSGPLEVQRDGMPLGSEIGVGHTTPVEVLLVSVGTCFALSCHAAFTLRGEERVEFKVGVSARKHDALPSRLSEVEVTVHFRTDVAAERSADVIKLAKGLCTVTNTLTAGVNVSVT